MNLSRVSLLITCQKYSFVMEICTNVLIQLNSLHFSFLSRIHSVQIIGTKKIYTCVKQLLPPLLTTQLRKLVLVCLNYCRSGNFRVFYFLRISDFETFHEVPLVALLH